MSDELLVRCRLCLITNAAFLQLHYLSLVLLALAPIHFVYMFYIEQAVELSSDGESACIQSLMNVYISFSLLRLYPDVAHYSNAPVVHCRHSAQLRGA